MRVMLSGFVRTAVGSRWDTKAPENAWDEVPKDADTATKEYNSCRGDNVIMIGKTNTRVTMSVSSFSDERQNQAPAWDRIRAG